jgi:hypothetical protein
LAKKAKIGQKSQNWPKRPKLAKKIKFFKKNQKKPKKPNLPKKPKLAKIRLFGKFWLFLEIL